MKNEVYVLIVDIREALGLMIGNLILGVQLNKILTVMRCLNVMILWSKFKMTGKRFTIKEFSTLDAMASIDVICDEGIELPTSTACDLLNALHEENEHYKSIFFELVETALTDKSCRELYCKGILGIFDKANSLNQARDMIKEHMN